MIMKRTILNIFALTALLPLAGCQVTTGGNSTVTLRGALADRFYIGVAMNEAQITGADRAGVDIILREFSSMVAENCMKSEEIQPREGEYDFTFADAFVDFGERNGMFIVGHTLIWHSQMPDWFTVDGEGNEVSREVLIGRMRDHISTVVGRYRGRVHGWDVVNEAVMEDGTFRNSPFYRIIGEDFIRLAFEFAHEADPDAELYYNDYSMFHPGKREGVVRLVNNLKSQGVRIDGIGMQGHLGLDFPAMESFEQSIKAFIGTGTDVMITEFDISALPTLTRGADISDTSRYTEDSDPYPDGLPASVAAEWNERIQAFFSLFLKYSDNIKRVTVWGLTDGDSWKNDFPVRGRTDYPLLYDRQYNPKPIVGWLKEQ